MKRNKNTEKRLAAALLTLILTLGCCGCSILPDSGAVDGYIGEVPESTGGKDIEKTHAADNIFSLNHVSNRSLNPLTATNHSNQLICSLVYENMLELDNNFEAIPNLITSWEYSDGGKYWTFTVDTTHVFHDGTQVTGKDIRYSLERALSSDRYSGRFSSVQGVSYDVDKVIVALGIGDTQFYKLLNIPVIKNGTNGDDYPMGSGPYMYNEDYTELLAFHENGFDQLPVETIGIKEYTKQEEFISAYEDSIIDAAFNDPSSYSNPGYASTNEIRTFPTTNLHYIAFNEQGNLGKYTNFRVAMQYAFDRSYLVEEMLHGNGTAAAFPMHPNCSDYPAALASEFDYDLDTCLLILENFGIKDYDGDGRLEMMNGTAQKFEVNFIICSDDSAKVGMANKFVADMASIGIPVNLYALTWSSFQEALTTGQYEVTENKFITWDMYYSEVKLRNNFDMTEVLQVRDKDNEQTNMNYTNSTDTTYVYYIEQYLAAGKLDRAAMYEAFCKYLSQNATVIALGFEKQQLITHRGVTKGLDPNLGNPFYGINGATFDMD